MEISATSTCLDCEYSLFGLTEPRCPECGREFNPGDASTMGPRRRDLSRVGVNIGPATMVARIIAMAATAISFWLSMSPSLHLNLVAIPIWVGVGWVALRGRGEPDARPRIAGRTIRASRLFIFSAILVCTHLPLRCLFWAEYFWLEPAGTFYYDKWQGTPPLPQASTMGPIGLRYFYIETSLGACFDFDGPVCLFHDVVLVYNSNPYPGDKTFKAGVRLSKDWYALSPGEPEWWW